jgi:hypothetical protein
MGSHGEAASAIEGLDSKYVWQGMGSPMVVKWMDAELQRKRREEHLAAMRQVGGAGAGRGRAGPGRPAPKAAAQPASCACTRLGGGASLRAQRRLLGVPLSALGGQPEPRLRQPVPTLSPPPSLPLLHPPQGLVPSMGMGPEVWLPAGKGLAYAPLQLLPMQLKGKLPPEGHECPPPGCAPDAIKLFVSAGAATPPRQRASMLLLGPALRLACSGRRLFEQPRGRGQLV